MPRKKSVKNKNLETLRDIVNEAISTNNEEFLVQLIYTMQKDYEEIAKLSTMGQYESSWSHKKTLDYITKET